VYLYHRFHRVWARPCLTFCRYGKFIISRHRIQLFEFSELLRPHKSEFKSMLEKWTDHNNKTPRYGCILLNEELTHMVLVCNYKVSYIVHNTTQPDTFDTLISFDHFFLSLRRTQTSRFVHSHRFSYYSRVLRGLFPKANWMKMKTASRARLEKRRKKQVICRRVCRRKTVFLGCVSELF